MLDAPFDIRDTPCGGYNGGVELEMTYRSRALWWSFLFFLVVDMIERVILSVLKSKLQDLISFLYPAGLSSVFGKAWEASWKANDVCSG